MDIKRTFINEENINNVLSDTNILVCVHIYNIHLFMYRTQCQG